MAIWVKDKQEEWHEFEDGATVQVSAMGAVSTLTVVGAAPDNVPLGGFVEWTAWATVDPDAVVKKGKGKGK
jgi:hypothetical protein